MEVRITQVSRQTGASPDEIRYSERRGFVYSHSLQLAQREVRDFPDDQVLKIGLIAKYRRLHFELDAAHQMAIDELAQPRLVE